MQATVVRLLDPGDTFVDVGGYAGFFSVIASKLVGPEGRILCFEPFKENNTMCSKNFDVNHFRNISLEQFALGNFCGLKKFVFDGELSTAKFAEPSSDEMSSIQVNVRRLVFIG